MFEMMLIDIFTWYWFVCVAFASQRCITIQYLPMATTTWPISVFFSRWHHARDFDVSTVHQTHSGPILNTLMKDLPVLMSLYELMAVRYRLRLSSFVLTLYYSEKMYQLESRNTSILALFDVTANSCMTSFISKAIVNLWSVQFLT